MIQNTKIDIEIGGVWLEFRFCILLKWSYGFLVILWRVWVCANALVLLRVREYLTEHKNCHRKWRRFGGVCTEWISLKGSSGGGGYEGVTFSSWRRTTVIDHFLFRFCSCCVWCCFIHYALVIRTNYWFDCRVIAYPQFLLLCNTLAAAAALVLSQCMHCVSVFSGGCIYD